MNVYNAISYTKYNKTKNAKFSNFIIVKHK